MFPSVVFAIVLDGETVRVCCIMQALTKTAFTGTRIIVLKANVQEIPKFLNGWNPRKTFGFENILFWDFKLQQSEDALHEIDEHLLIKLVTLL